MSKKIISVLICCMVVIGVLTGCGKGSSSKEPVDNGVFTTTINNFRDKFAAVVKDNEELKGMSLDSETEPVEDGVSRIAVWVDDEPEGFYLIKTDTKGNIQSVITSFSWTECDKYTMLLQAVYMTVDSTLSYAEAAKIVHIMDDSMILGEKGTEKNGITYKYMGKISGYANHIQFPTPVSEDAE